MHVASFQTRARAIDHLGRGQIADAPTAISELWKNAYDAYARRVELHIFEGTPPIAAIYDNGHGMSMDEILSHWLVIGTESKVGTTVKEEDRFGLPTRTRQGEKGIGRLSAAFLAPMTLIISKRIDHPFAAILVDWRFFENPYLLISDIQFPVQELENITDLPLILPSMFASLRENIIPATNDAHGMRICNAWDTFSHLEQQNGAPATTRDSILSFESEALLDWRHLQPWWEILNATPEPDTHGTAMLALEAKTELACWVDGEYESDDSKDVKSNLMDTLISFTDPYRNINTHFEYGVTIHKKGKPSEVAIHSSDEFTLNEFHALEHYVEGAFNAQGAFTGRVVVFGTDRGKVEILPAKPTTQTTKGKLGPFKLFIGTYEQEQRSTTLSTEKWAQFEMQKEKYGGICMYRDLLRVLPYGKPNADLFGIEERRTNNAGRYFFSYRRSFGCVSFSSSENPNLKDKAGREGLVDNHARREMVRLVRKVLKDVADDYFGRNSFIRQTELPAIKKQYLRSQKAASRAKKSTLSKFLKEIKQKLPLAVSARDEALALYEQLQHALSAKEYPLLSSIKLAADKLEELRDTLRLPIRPSGLGDDEEGYREYRDAYTEFCVILERLRVDIGKCEAQGLLGDPRAIATRKFQSNEARISAQVNKYYREIETHTARILAQWNAELLSDRKQYRAQAIDFLTELSKGKGLSPVLNMLDSKHAEMRDELEIKYSGIIESLDQLAEGIDVQAAFQWVDATNEELERKVQMLHTVAQLGISVEIIGHELEALESQVSRHLRRMPSKVKDLQSYKDALEAHSALTDRLRFLSPLRKTAYRSRIDISGAIIFNYLKDFFGDTFETHRTKFEATASFQKITIKDLPSRIYPTFINLVNNALYWVQSAEIREIKLDFQDGKAIIADSGKGVDRDDIPKLFELFFSRRSNGRGIGLYLCKQNLSVANHTIRYANETDPHVLQGAHFIIEFNGVNHA